MNPPSRSRRPGPLAVAWSPATWGGALYLLSSIVLGTVLFALTVVLVVTAWATSLVWIGLPLLLVTATLIRAFAHVERQRAALVRPATATAAPPPAVPPGTGLLGLVKAAWGDPVVGRACVYLVGLYVPLLVLDALALGIWLTFLAGITIPLWYWAVPMTFSNGATAHGLAWGWFPNGPDGPGAIGLWVGDLPSSLLAAGMCAALFVGACHLVRVAARVHSGAAAALLGPPVDPLAEARAVLARPGPLRPLPGTRTGPAA